MKSTNWRFMKVLLIPVTFFSRFLAVLFLELFFTFLHLFCRCSRRRRDLCAWWKAATRPSLPNEVATGTAPTLTYTASFYPPPTRARGSLRQSTASIRSRPLSLSITARRRHRIMQRMKLVASCWICPRAPALLRLSIRVPKHAPAPPSPLPTRYEKNLYLPWGCL